MIQVSSSSIWRERTRRLQQVHPVLPASGIALHGVGEHVHVPHQGLRGVESVGAQAVEAQSREHLRTIRRRRSREGRRNQLRNRRTRAGSGGGGGDHAGTEIVKRRPRCVRALLCLARMHTQKPRERRQLSGLRRSRRSSRVRGRLFPRILFVLPVGRHRCRISRIRYESSRISARCSIRSRSAELRRQLARSGRSLRKQKLVAEDQIDAAILDGKIRAEFLDIDTIRWWRRNAIPYITVAGTGGGSHHEAEFRSSGRTTAAA